MEAKFSRKEVDREKELPSETKLLVEIKTRQVVFKSVPSSLTWRAKENKKKGITFSHTRVCEFDL